MKKYIKYNNINTYDYGSNDAFSCVQASQHKRATFPKSLPRHHFKGVNMMQTSDAGPHGWQFSCSKKVDDISKHESRHDPKFDPKHGVKPVPENEPKPGLKKNPNEKTMPGEVKK